MAQAMFDPKDHFEIAGYFARYQYLSRQLKKGDTLMMVLEPTNAYDVNAIKIVTEKNEHCGYVPRMINRTLKNYLNMKLRVSNVNHSNYVQLIFE
jgi:hypothetical protein